MSARQFVLGEKASAARRDTYPGRVPPPPPHDSSCSSIPYHLQRLVALRSACASRAPSALQRAGVGDACCPIACAGRQLVRSLTRLGYPPSSVVPGRGPARKHADRLSPVCAAARRHGQQPQPRRCDPQPRRPGGARPPGPPRDGLLWYEHVRQLWLSSSRICTPCQLAAGGPWSHRRWTC